MLKMHANANLKFLFVNRFVCWGDPCVWRSCSSWICHWTHVHHWWRGWGESGRYSIVGKTTDCLVNAKCKILLMLNFVCLSWSYKYFKSNGVSIEPISVIWHKCFFFVLVFKVHNYKRLTPFSISNHAVESLDNLKPGDCIVCFSKNDIYSISRQIEIRGLECAVIYGSLPPGKVHMMHLQSGFSLLNCQY